MLLFKWRSLALLLVILTCHVDLLTSLASTSALRSLPEKAQDFLFNDDDLSAGAQHTRRWCQQLVNDLQGRSNVEKPSEVLFQLNLCIDYLLDLQEEHPNDESVRTELNELYSWVDKVKRQLPAGRGSQVADLPVLNFVEPTEKPQQEEAPDGQPVTMAMPSQAWCGVVVAELYDKYYLSPADGNQQGIGQPELIRANLETCIEFISAELEANPHDASLGLLLSSLKHSLTLLSGLQAGTDFPRPNLEIPNILDFQEEPATAETHEEPGEPQEPHEPEQQANNNHPWIAPSANLLAWLEPPLEQMVYNDDEVAAVCDDLAAFLEANVEQREPGPRVDRLWGIPLLSFKRRLKQCSLYYKKRGDEPRAAIIDLTIDRIRRHIREEAQATGLERFQPPGQPLLVWLQVPEQQMVEVEAELQAHCNELVTFLRANYGPAQHGPNVDERWNIALVSFKRRLHQCRGHYKRLGDGERWKIINMAYERTRARIYKQGRRQQNDPVEPGVHRQGPRGGKQPRL